MSTPTRRRPSPAAFRRRRLTLLLIVLAVAAAVVLALWQPWWAGGTPSGSQGPAPSTSATTSATTPVSTPPTEAAPPAESSGEPSGESEAPAEPALDPSASASDPTAACTTADISVHAVTDKDSYGSGEVPQLSITLSNTSAAPCLINVGTATQEFEITSGPDTWWRSTDCQSESSDQVVSLAAGQTVSSVEPLPWDRTRSSVSTCGSSRPQAPKGYFHLQVSIGGIQAADTKVFELR